MFLDMNVISVRGGSTVFLLIVFLLCMIMDNLFICCILPPNIQKPCALVILVIITVFSAECSRAINEDTKRKTFRVFEGDQRALTHGLLKKKNILWDDTASTTL